MKLCSGITLLDEGEGAGEAAGKGDRITYNLRIYLNRGEEVWVNEGQVEHLPKEMVRTDDAGRPLVDHKITLGNREATAGVEYSLTGMKAGGYRKVRVSPHLGYRGAGVGGLIPADAVLIIELWLRAFN